MGVEIEALYYDLLERVRHTRGWEAWISFFREGVMQTFPRYLCPGNSCSLQSGAIGSILRTWVTSAFGVAVAALVRVVI